MTTRQEWIDEKMQSAELAALVTARDAVGIAAYLNAPTLTEVPGVGEVPVVLGIEEISDLIPFSEWEKIAEPESRWKATAKLAGAQEAAQPAIKAIDAILNREKGTSDVPLELAVLSVIQLSETMADEGDTEGGAALGGGLIVVLASSGLLSPEAAATLQSAMIVDAPSTWEVGQSIAEEAIGGRVLQSELFNDGGGF